MRVLVTGATGTVGRAVVERLLADGHTPVAAMRRLEAGGLPDEVERVRFDFEEPSTYTGALHGADGLFLMRPPALGADAVVPVVDAAVQAGVPHVTFLSVLGAGSNPLLPHRGIERALEDSPLAYTHLRASNFLQNFAEQHAPDIRERGEVFVPAGKGRIGYVDARDVGAVAAVTLTTPGHDRRAYTLTGPEAIDHYAVAGALSQAAGRLVIYREPGLFTFLWHELNRGKPLPFVLVMGMLYTTARLGLARRVTGTIAQLLGRPARSIDDFARDYADVWRRTH